MDSSRALWGRFEKSGKLADYLDFCAERRKQKAAARPADDAEREEAPEDQSSL